jgi:transcriptional regulator GlxA family with amidase domain
MTLQIHLLGFDGMEALDFAGPFEVFSTAARMAERMGLVPGPAAPWCRVQTFALTRDAVVARAGLRVLPDVCLGDMMKDDASLKDAMGPDVLLIPGGVMDAVLNSRATLGWIAQQARLARITASVCTGAFALAAAGVITDQRVTTHWEDMADLRAAWPRLQVIDGVRWEDTGPVVTSAGISAGIDMSLHLVERLGGRALAERTARQMEFAWTEN